MLSVATDSHSPLGRQVLAEELAIVDVGQAAPVHPQVCARFFGWTLQADERPGTCTFTGNRPATDGRAAVLFNRACRSARPNASRVPFGGWYRRWQRHGGVLSYSLAPVGLIGDVVVTLWSMDRLDSRRIDHEPSGKVTDRWLVCIDGDPCITRVERNGNVIRTTGRFGDRLIPVVPGRDVREQVAQIDSGFSKTLNRFPPWRDYAPWRREMSQRLAVLWVAQCVLLGAAALAVRRGTVPRLGRLLSVVATCCIVLWIVGCLWLVFGYFGTDWT